MDASRRIPISRRREFDQNIRNNRKDPGDAASVTNGIVSRVKWGMQCGRTESGYWKTQEVLEAADAGLLKKSCAGRDEPLSP